MTRISGLLLSLATIFGATALLLSVSKNPQANSIWCLAHFCDSANPTITTDPLNPFLTADYAELLQQRNQMKEAENQFLSAVKKGPNIPPILIRTANFYIAQDQFKKALPYLMRILALTRVYNDIIFSYYRRSGLSMETLIAEGLPLDDSKPANAFLTVLIDSKDSAAPLLWQHIQKKWGAEPELHVKWVNHLFQSKQYLLADRYWRQFIKEPDGNKISNPAFATKPTGSLLDWVITPDKHVEITQLANGGIQLIFEGVENTNFANITQFVVVEPGTYTVNVEVETDRISTNEGLRFRLYDPSQGKVDSTTDPLLGTNSLRKVSIEATIGPETPFVAFTVVRRPSERFDNQIRGKAIIYSVVMTRK